MRAAVAVNLDETDVYLYCSPMSQLEYAVHVAPSVPTAIEDRPPGLTQRVWSPISSTLIYGKTEAVLVDPLMTRDQARLLGDWVEASGKTLSRIYVTHGHGDHWFGLATLLERFPGAEAMATAKVVEHARSQMTPDFLASFWEARFPKQIPDSIAAPDAMDGDSFELEGEALVVIDLGHTDTDDTTALHIPSLDLVVAGDAVYNNVHLYLAESPPPQRQAWLAALDTIDALGARAVVAGHKDPSRGDDPIAIVETRRYIDDFSRLEAQTSTTEELYEAMMACHGGRINNGALWGSARASKG
jgi:glyoxylase-like metal-dependent hydrolase (beta-lactamase superfamily II)